MYKIMLVEDDANLRAIYGDRLLAEGFEIISAKDGEEGLALAVKEKPDLIISDVMMPKISGFDMLDILRTTPETKNTKVIMMTALSQGEDKERADKLGADKYLVKSQVTLEDVARVVHEVLDDGTVKIPDTASPAPAAQPAETTPPATTMPVATPAPSSPIVNPIAEPSNPVASQPSLTAAAPAATPVNPIVSPSPAPDTAPASATPVNPITEPTASPVAHVSSSLPVQESTTTDTPFDPLQTNTPSATTDPAPSNPTLSGTKIIQPVTENFGQPSTPKIYELYEKELASQSAAPAPTPTATSIPVVDQSQPAQPSTPVVSQPPATQPTEPTVSQPAVAAATPAAAPAPAVAANQPTNDGFDPNSIAL